MRKAFSRKIDVETIEIPHREPDFFDMYVYNDFAGYGYQEVVENNMAEFNKVLNSKNGKTEELWTILESMPIWLLDEPNVPWHMIDDGERSWLTYNLLGFMFLTGLNRIDQEGELKPDSKYKDLSLVMSLWARVADDLGGDTDDPFDGAKGGGDSSLGDYAGFSLLWFRYLLALAKKKKLIFLSRVSQILTTKLMSGLHKSKEKSNCHPKKQTASVGRQRLLFLVFRKTDSMC